MSIRFRNGHKYYRYTIWDKEKHKYRYIERKCPLKDFRTSVRYNYRNLQKREIEAIFEHFREPSSAFIPLHFIYIYNVDPKKVYDLTFEDCNKMKLSIETKHILQRQRQRISDARRLYGYLEFNDFVCVNLKTGKKLSHYQYDYIKKWIRKKFIPLNEADNQSFS